MSKQSIDDLAMRNRSRILDLVISDAKRAELLSISLVAEKLGESSMDLALRMVIEQALLCYIGGQFDMLHIMGTVIHRAPVQGGRA